jgi:hypothetical protein
MAHGKSTEFHGVGQSGYTAGRTKRDPALERELHSRNEEYPRGADDELVLHDLVTDDDRFTGRGGPLPPDDEGEGDDTVTKT